VARIALLIGLSNGKSLSGVRLHLEIRRSIGPGLNAWAPVLAVVLFIGHDATASGAMLTGAAQMVAGVVARFIIGIVAALLGVAGGELLIPTSRPAIRARYQTRG
jgi:hypothetical protein